MQQIKNKTGEELFLVIVTNSKEFNNPFISLKTWSEAKEIFEKRIKERNDNSYMIKQITVLRNEEEKELKAQLLCNQKGWGRDYFEDIRIKKAYSF